MLQHCLGLPFWHYQLVLSWYPHQPESHQLNLNKVCYLRTFGPKDRTPGLPGSDENTWTNERAPVTQYFDSTLPTGGSSLHIEILSVRNHFNISNLRSFDKKKIYLQYRQVHVNVPCPGKHEKLFPN